MKPVTNILATTSPPGTGNPAPMQQDGSQNVMPAKATKAPLQTRSASPSNYNTSGIERGMGQLADKLHPPKLRTPSRR